MTIGSKSMPGANATSSIMNKGGRCLSSNIQNPSGLKKRKLLKGRLPIIAEVDFEDKDETDIPPAKFFQKSSTALVEGWPDALLNPWSLANDEACCKAVTKLLKEESCDRSALLAWLCPALHTLALSDCGSGIVHTALEIATGSDRRVIASQFHGCVNDLCASPTGHLVLSDLIGTMPVSVIGFVASELEGKACDVAKHRFGYRVLEAMIMHGSHAQTSKLSGELVRAAVELSKDPYGHNILRHLSEHGMDAWRCEIIQRLMMEKSLLMQYQRQKQCGAELNYPKCEHDMYASSVMGIA